MDVNLQDILSRVGENGTPLKKLSKEAKKEFKGHLKQLLSTRQRIPDPLLLRCLLSTNELISTNLKDGTTISAALNLKDILKHAKKLSGKEEIIDAANFFQSLIEGVKNSKSIKTVKSTINCVKKWQKWVDASHGKPTNKTEESIIALIKELALIIPQPKSLDNKIIDKYKKLISPLFEIILNIASKSKSCDTYVVSLKVINVIIEKYPSLIINDILSDDMISKNIETLKENILSHSEYYILNGDANKLRELNTAISNILNMNTILTERIQKVWDVKGATLNTDVQSVIKNILFDEPVLQKTFKLSNKELSSSIRQLATALMGVWESRNDGPRAIDSFELVASVLKKYFNLALGGRVGEIGQFNKIVHESIDNISLSANDMIEVVRPWVEWQGPAKRLILVKALVKRSG